MTQILLIGGNGYVGSQVYSLLRDTHDVCSVDLCLFPENLGYSRMQHFGELNSEFLKDFEYVILLAAHSSVSMAKMDPQGAILNNVTHVIQLQQKLSPTQKFIYASSSSVYGSGTYDATESQVSYQAHNYYDISKQVADAHMHTLIQQSHAIVGLRFGTVCGTSVNMRTDLFLNSMVHNCLTKNDFWYQNPHIHRSVLHVQDAASAIQACVTSTFVSGIYNCHSFNTTIQESVNLVQHMCGTQAQLTPSTHTPYDFTINSDLFRRTYAWQPTHDLHATLQDLIQHMPTMNTSDRTHWDTRKLNHDM